MNSDQLKKILVYLVQATDKGQVPWKAITDGEFQVSFGESTVSTGWAGEDGGFDLLRLSAQGKSPGPYLSIYNSDGVKIITLHTGNIKKYEMPDTILKAIYERAKNQVFRYDETFNDILKGLTGNGKE